MIVSCIARPSGVFDDDSRFRRNHRSYSGPGGSSASQLLTLSALPIILLLAAIEWLNFRQTDKFDVRDSAASIAMGAVYVLVAEGVMGIAIVVPAYEWLYQFRLFTSALTPVNLLVLFLLVDFCFYLFHLAAHRIRFLWGVHEVHHASEHFNYTVAFRQSVLYAVVGVYIFFIPALMLGFAPELVLLMLAANLVFQIFPHTQWFGKFPKIIEWVFNTPSNHRVHHGRNPRYLDRNMGGVLMIWDHMLGTYAAESADEPVEYGVVSLANSSPGFNPIILTFREYVRLLKDAARPGPLSVRLKHFWGPPEWERPAIATGVHLRPARCSSSVSSVRDLPTH
jgi:sterol desaturase/sphingolipid hydroxylase (fatty acid hydroxylase superfamily)